MLHYHNKTKAIALNRDPLADAVNGACHDVAGYVDSATKSIGDYLSGIVKKSLDLYRTMESAREESLARKN